jgi:hypothetical protein
MSWRKLFDRENVITVNETNKENSQANINIFWTIIKMNITENTLVADFMNCEIPDLILLGSISHFI